MRRSRLLWMAACFLAAGCDAAPGTAPVTAIRPTASASLPGDAMLSCRAIETGITQTSDRVAQDNARRRHLLADGPDQGTTIPTGTDGLERINRLILLGRSKHCFA